MKVKVYDDIDLSHSIIAVSDLLDINCAVKFEDDSCTITHDKNTLFQTMKHKKSKIMVHQYRHQ